MAEELKKELDIENEKKIDDMVVVKKEEKKVEKKVENKEEISEKEKRIRAITRIYYSNPKLQNYLVDFSKNREVVPRYFEGFGKRPDIIQYPSDIISMVNKGATSFHCSEELWHDPLQLNVDLPPEQQSSLRSGWDLLIDIDSPFLDCSKIAAKLIIAALEHHGIRNYGIKFSGSKGFHIIVASSAFPLEFKEQFTKSMFPDWARAVSEYLMHYIRKDYNEQAAEILTDFEAIKERTNLSHEDLQGASCLICHKPAKKGLIVEFNCPNCGLILERRNPKLTKRRLRCLNDKCGGILEAVNQTEYYYCENDFDPDNEKLFLSSDKYPNLFEEIKGVSAEKIAALDLVLVSPRHLFRMPYSLHEKTALASIVLTKEEIDSFSPKDASPLQINLKPFMPNNDADEAQRLLSAALDWKKGNEREETFVTIIPKQKKQYSPVDFKDLTEEMYPQAIKKLLNGLKDGKKRGLFILITFLRAINTNPEKIIEIIKNWNLKNSPPLKEGYIRSQLDWHFKQKRQILPPNYDNDSFYKDLGLIDKKPDTKNPIVDALRAVRSKQFK